MTMTAEPNTAAPPPAATPPAEPKPKTPFEAAAKVIRHIQLGAIHFSEFSAQALQDPTVTDDEHLSLSASTRFLVPTVVPTGDGFSTKTTLVFQMEGKTEGIDSSLPIAAIRATIEATYTLKAEAPEFSEEDRKDFALCYCPFHVWGYWREYVQSSLARLDLPQMTIPLFLIAQAPQMVREKLD